MTHEFNHVPVLAMEVLEFLQPFPGGYYVDATVGGGGHAEMILEQSVPNGSILGIDADPAALRASEERLARFPGRVTLAPGYFDHLGSIAPSAGFGRVNGVLFDLGVSSYQLATAERGFSFSVDGPLDMRLGSHAERTAADLVNSASARELQLIFQEFGEERYSRRVAERIVSERDRRPFQTTRRLAETVVAAKPGGSSDRIHPATRVFQALRIAVNDELGRLQRALPQALDLLEKGGRIVVISFHSLEDRIVKQFLRRESRDCICPPRLPTCVCGHQQTVRILTTRPLTASPQQVATNPRARSAKLRAAERV